MLYEERTFRISASVLNVVPPPGSVPGALRFNVILGTVSECVGATVFSTLKVFSWGFYWIGVSFIPKHHSKLFMSWKSISKQELVQYQARALLSRGVRAHFIMAKFLLNSTHEAQ